MIKETSNNAIVDTTCPCTVSGDNWLHQFNQRLPYHLINGVIFQKSSAGIVFGDGRRQVCVKTAFVQMKIGSLACKLKIEILNGNLTLLLSVRFIEKAQLTVQAHKKIIITDTGEIVPMKKLSSGHLTVDVFPTSSDDHVFLSKNFDHMDSKQIFKLHCQFGHCSGKK